MIFKGAENSNKSENEFSICIFKMSSLFYLKFPEFRKLSMYDHDTNPNTYNNKIEYFFNLRNELSQLMTASLSNI